MRTIRRRVLVTAAVLALAALAMTPGLRQSIAQLARQGASAVAAMAARQEVELPSVTVYALQLGVYDNGEHALAQQKRLTAEGTPCVIWQREQMRLICDTASDRALLSADAAKGQEAWIITEELPRIVLRVGAGAQEIEAIRALLTLPDALFAQLCGHAPLGTLVENAREQARAGLQAHPEHALYAQLAGSLDGWCTLMEETVQRMGETASRSYARATMHTLCYELRQALLQQADQSAASTASAQRTPSTAAEVMPPA